MADSLHHLPPPIELDRDEYRLQHAALEAALDVFDRAPGADPAGTARKLVEQALKRLLGRIWPFLDELDGDG